MRIVYSPLDAVNLAAAHPDRKVVFFAIGFETTAPPNAMAVWLARRRRLTNFSVLVSHVLVPPIGSYSLQPITVPTWPGPKNPWTGLPGACRFEVCDRKWRGVGIIPKSGFKLRYEYRDHDAERLFEVDDIETQESSVCISGQVLKGLKKPHDCPAFGKECTPLTPLGATMVSSEGACAAYYLYGRHLEAARRLGERGGVNPPRLRDSRDAVSGG